MTPLRDATLTKPLVDRVRIIRDSGVEYSDGSEEAVRRLIESAADIRSSAEELEGAASTWAERYHLCRQRSNFLRWLDLTPVATALEIGAGCGAVTRYLGENVAHVDAVEPVVARATIAARRCRDLPGVQVFAGEVSDVPRSGAYDLVVVCGVLEYIGLDEPDQLPAWRSFLHHLAGCLSPTGVLVLAIENQVGVKYLAGAPEDHSGVSYDGLIGYPARRGARTTSRRQLVEMLSSVGLNAAVLGAFPDYKLTEVLLADELFEDPVSALAHRLPRFPSPDWTGHDLRITSEGALWRTLVEAGVGSAFPNSLVVIACPDPASVHRPARLALSISNARRSCYSTITEVVRDGPSTVRFLRTQLYPDVQRAGETALEHVVSSSTYVEGEDMREAFLAAGDDERRALLLRWFRLLDTSSQDSPTGCPVDLTPTNIVIDRSGDLVAIDQEWFSMTADLEFVKLRGLAALARWMCSRGVPETAARLASLVGLEMTPQHEDRLVAAELGFRRAVHPLRTWAGEPDVDGRFELDVRRDLTLKVPPPEQPSRTKRARQRIARLIH